MWKVPWNFSIFRISKDLYPGINRNISDPSLVSGLSRSSSLTTCRCTNKNDVAVQKVIFTRNYTTMQPSFLMNTTRAPSWKVCSILSPSLSMPLFGNITGKQEGDSSIVAGTYIQSRGLKYKGRVRRRCKDCFMIWINGNLWNLCKTHQRHKAILKPPYWANQRILTHATMAPKRAW
ncbi:unnamed protein product [Orchesella dallaii]|uniref:39S ribosomal protein L36, mitochondrial n=1 Tax=Orchesella dallaii TaxID=48710 RepID=A0ABP1QF51_9HEXA